MKTRADRIIKYVADHMTCDECPYESKCGVGADCADTLKGEINRELRESLLRELYLKFDAILEERQAKEPIELQNGIILARIELLSYIRKCTEDE